MRTWVMFWFVVVEWLLLLFVVGLGIGKVL